MYDSVPASQLEKRQGVLDVFPGTAAPMPAPLPVPLTPLVGREEEAMQVADLLTSPDVRVVTLVGPGGIGKTRLALHIAASLESAWPDGVAFVDLSAIRSADLVIPAIGSALGIRQDQEYSPLEALRNVLRSRQLLLVLDNFEQVVDAGPDLATLLKSCPAVTLLVTSRTRLHISAEHVVPVAPLQLPQEPAAVQTGQPPAQLADIAAVRLFVQRARAVEPAFQLTDHNAPAVAAIVQRLDGLPLAIELAAARIPVFTPSELLQRLEPRLPQLTGGPRDDPPRHQTMHNSIEWSHDLMTSAEKRVFRCLSVFAGGCTIAAAEEVCGGEESVIGVIESIANQSLIRLVKPADSTTNGMPPRLAMLETVREFAAEQLLASGDETPRNHHAAFYLNLATLATRIFHGEEPGDWRLLIEPEMGNMRTALAGAVETGNADTALSLASATEWTAFQARGVWDPVGMAASLAREQEQWLLRALAMPGGSPPARARALISAAWACLVHDRVRSILLSEEALALAHRLGDTFALANASAVRGLAALHDGQPARARPFLLEALSGFRALNQPGRAAWVLSELAVTETRKAIDEGGDPASLARAAANYEEALAIFQTIGQHRGISRAMHGRAYIAYLQRDLAESLRQVREILTTDWEQRAPVTHYIEDVADIAGRIGRPDVAVRLYGAAEVQREYTGRPIHSLFREEYEREVANSRRVLSDKEFAAGWAAGRLLSLDQAVEIALSPFEADVAPSTQEVTLSPRELEVLHLLVAGHTDREIADLLFISTRTAEGHVRGLCRKLGARNRAAAIAIALSTGLTEPLNPPNA